MRQMIARIKEYCIVILKAGLNLHKESVLMTIHHFVTESKRGRSNQHIEHKAIREPLHRPCPPAPCSRNFTLIFPYYMTNPVAAPYRRNEVFFETLVHNKHSGRKMTRI
jgi:hypothetical protein